MTSIFLTVANSQFLQEKFCAFSDPDVKYSLLHRETARVGDKNFFTRMLYSDLFH